MRFSDSQKLGLLASAVNFLGLQFIFWGPAGGAKDTYNEFVLASAHWYDVCEELAIVSICLLLFFTLFSPLWAAPLWLCLAGNHGQNIFSKLVLYVITIITGLALIAQVALYGFIAVATFYFIAELLILIALLFVLQEESGQRYR